jgi:hypothetical protein
MHGNPELPQLSPGDAEASGLCLVWKPLPWATPETPPQGFAGLKCALEIPARGPSPSQPADPSRHAASPDRSPTAEPDVALHAGIFRPGLLIEAAPRLAVDLPYTTRLVDAEAPRQADPTQIVPSPRSDAPPDAFTWGGDGNQQQPPPDPQPPMPISALPIRNPIAFNLVPELARAFGGSTSLDTPAAGATQHFYFQSRPFATSAASQPLAGPVPAGADDLYLRLAEQMYLQVREGKSAMRIQLRPDVLGRLEIKAESTAAGLTATIVAETHGVKNFLEQNLHNLYRSLQDLGLKVDRILVTEDGSPHHAPGQSNHGDGQHGQDRAYPARETSWPLGDPVTSTEAPPVASPTLGPWMLHSTFHAVA